MSTKNSGGVDNTSLSDRLDSNSSLSLSVAELFYPSFKRLFEGEEFVDELEDDLGKANINTPVEIYVSAALGYGAILGGILGIVIGAFAWILISSTLDPTLLPLDPIPFTEYDAMLYLIAILSALKYPFASLILGLAGAAVGFIVALSLASYYPKYVARGRSREIELLMGDGLAFMYSLSVGGTNQLQVMEAIANAEDTYGELSVEFQRIVYEMKYFNTDYQTAVKNVAEVTPSDELEAFLSDMLSVIDSGGDMTSFLETQQEMMRERGRKKQEEMLDAMEFFGEMYISLNILPMGLLIVLVIVSMMGTPQLLGLYVTVYAIIPGLNIMFALIIATVKKDEVGDGRLDTEDDVAAKGEDETELTSMGVIDHYATGSNAWFFKSIGNNELRHRITHILQSPWDFFRIRPPYALILTLPITVLVMGVLLAAGLASPSITEMINAPYIQTVMWLYVPIFINLGPLAFFYEWNRRTRGRITDTLTQDIRKLANANETGQPLLEAMRVSAAGDSSLLGREFQRMYKKTKFGTSLSPALIEFNNRYRIPRLARVVKLIEKAQEASSNITEVLQTAAITSRYQDELVQDRLQRTRMQVAVSGISFIVFLGVIMMLEVYFLGEMLSGVDLESDNPVGGGFGDLNISLISMLFFHAVTLQAMCAGGIGGYIQTGKFRSSFKYIVLYMMIAAVAWGIFAV